MGKLSSLWSGYIYLPYGLAILSLGLVMWMAARSPQPVLPRRALHFLAAFGFLHGGYEWVELIVQIEARSGLSLGPWVQALTPLILAGSFALLLQSGVEVLVSLGLWSRWTRWLPLGLLGLWATATAAFFPHPRWPELSDWNANADALCRLCLALPGSLISAAALIANARAQFETGSKAVRLYLRAAAIALVGYGLAAGLVGPAATGLGGWPLTTEAFRMAVGLPIQVFRALFALAFAGLIAEAVVVQAARMRTSLEVLREEFISVVAHDLRAPLSTISLSAQLLERLPPGAHATDRERSLLTNIASSTQRLARMIDDLLDASRIEAKRMELRKEPVDLLALIRAVVERAAGMTQGHPVRLSLPEHLPPIILDPARVEQVLDNLLSNAAKHSQPGAEIVVAAEATPAAAVISITNFGSGIGPDEQARLFSRFYRGKAARAGKIEGLGLGLYIAQGLVEAHGGRVWVESEVGRFATFRVALPSAARIDKPTSETRG